MPVYLCFDKHVLLNLACTCELSMVLMKLDFYLCTHDLTSMYF